MKIRLFKKIQFTIVALILMLLLGTQSVYADNVLQGIDTKKYPAVKLLLSSTAFDVANSTEQVVKISENGRQIKDIHVGSLTVKPDPLAVVLLIDSSGSMKGMPIEDAKAAANQFIGLLGGDDQISIVSFSSEPSLAADFTSDKGMLTNSINAIQASGETALYDGLTLAANQISKSNLKQKCIVLLSDGGDTVSKVNPEACIGQIRDLKVPIYIIALKTPELDMGILQRISAESGGKLIQAINSDELKPFYSRLAKQIKNQVEVEYKSPKFDTKDIDLDIVIGRGDNPARVKTTYPNPIFLNSYNDSGKYDESPSIADNNMYALLIPLIAFLAASLFIFGVVSTLTKRKSILNEQLGMYEEIWSQAEFNDGTHSLDENPYVSKALEVIGQFAEKRGFTELVREKLEQAGLPLRPVEYIFFHTLIVLIPGYIVQLLFGNLLLTILFVVLITVLPILIVQIIIDRRRNQFNAMLPDVVSMVAGSLRAGYSLLQAIALVVDESKPPISTEFRRALTEARLGLPLEVTLEKMAKRVGSADFYWTVLAINIQREVGGNLAEVLDIVAKTIRERYAFGRHIKALTAEGRLSAYILIGLPFAIAALLSLINPGYILVLFTDLLGWIMISVASILMVIGIFWMRKIISIEV